MFVFGPGAGGPRLRKRAASLSSEQAAERSGALSWHFPTTKAPFVILPARESDPPGARRPKRDFSFAALRPLISVKYAAAGEVSAKNDPPPVE